MPGEQTVGEDQELPHFVPFINKGFPLIRDFSLRGISHHKGFPCIWDVPLAFNSKQYA